jgi:hypothetical protein
MGRPCAASPRCGGVRAGTDSDLRRTAVPAQIPARAAPSATACVIAGYDEVRHVAEKIRFSPLPVFASCWRNLLEGDRGLCAGPWGFCVPGTDSGPRRSSVFSTDSGPCGFSVPGTDSGPCGFSVPGADFLRCGPLYPAQILPGPGGTPIRTLDEGSPAGDRGGDGRGKSLFDNRLELPKSRRARSSGSAWGRRGRPGTTRPPPARAAGTRWPSGRRSPLGRVGMSGGPRRFSRCDASSAPANGTPSGPVVRVPPENTAR